MKKYISRIVYLQTSVVVQKMPHFGIWVHLGGGVPVNGKILFINSLHLFIHRIK